MLKDRVNKITNVVNNNRVGREPLSFNLVKDSASHPTIEFLMLLLQLRTLVISSIILSTIA